jgi:hypothetical protein
MGFAPGTLVRIIRQPYFDVIGVVDHFHMELQAMEFGCMIRNLGET